MGLGPTLPSADMLPSAVDALPWFAHLGDPFPGDPTVAALQDWAGVPAPDDERTLELALDQQARFDLLRDERTEVTFRDWHDRVILATATVDGLHTDGDAWDPRTQCRYDAAFTVGLAAGPRAPGADRARPPAARRRDGRSWCPVSRGVCPVVPRLRPGRRRSGGRA